MDAMREIKTIKEIPGHSNRLGVRRGIRQSHPFGAKLVKLQP
jgi:hypothetical protein